MSTQPRPEYPRPQFVRKDWLCLNGEWGFEFDPGDTGMARGLCDRELKSIIVVPFCPESELSGIGDTDIHHAVWYRKAVTIPEQWSGRNVVLHFQAVDYDTTVWVNGKEVARHRGGFTPFSCELKDIVEAGELALIVVRARDNSPEPQARGKQSREYAPHSCLYTRTTGIWQTVWLEPVAAMSMKRPRITPRLTSSSFSIDVPLAGVGKGAKVTARLLDGDGVIAESTCQTGFDFFAHMELPIPERRRRFWSPADPFLYDLEFELSDHTGTIVDSIKSYAGLRGLAIDGKRMLLNGKPLFQRLVLDQGYYPDGIMTAPTDAALARDIQLSISAGYNGARLHQKVFEERFLYHADRLGYLIWGEFADWGCSGFGTKDDSQKQTVNYVTQWIEAVERDYSHPSIVGWCPLNETWQNISDHITVLDDATRALFLVTKMADTTRPVLDTSGYAHRVSETDVYDSHDYISEKDFAVGIEEFRKRHSTDPNAAPYNNSLEMSVPYRDQPYFISEFGGFKWDTSAGAEGPTWGYGSNPTSIEDFHMRFDAVCKQLLDNPNMFAYCYTQLTDIHPESNGLFTDDREPKFDVARLREAQTKVAAIEQGE